ncbi:thiamine pyrophosphate enzyme [Klebsiella michiganensis]|nr:thiamine pyrophosphate enzyme [Klebsiella michiganensis]
MTLLIMNDGGYGVMRGIQDKYFGGRQYYNELHTPDFTLLAQAIGLQAWSVDRAEDFQAVMTEALAMPGPSVVEVKMGEIGRASLCRPAAEDAVLIGRRARRTPPGKTPGLRAQPLSLPGEGDSARRSSLL